MRKARDPPDNFPLGHSDQSPCLLVKVDAIAAEHPSCWLLRGGKDVVSTLPELGDVGLNMQVVSGQILISCSLENGDEGPVTPLRLRKHVLYSLSRLDCWAFTVSAQGEEEKKCARE